MTFGEQLKRVLEENGMSQRKFAMSMGKDPTYISRIINGNISVSWDMIKLFADTLDVSPASFFVNTEDDMIAILLQELSEDMIEFIKDRPNVPWLYLAEFAELHDKAGDDNEKRVKSLVSLGRAAGIKYVIATQRPTVDSISGSIKALASDRLCFRVADALNSRVILDRDGGEALPNIPGRCIFLTGADFIEVQTMLYEEK